MSQIVLDPTDDYDRRRISDARLEGGLYGALITVVLALGVYLATYLVL